MSIPIPDPRNERNILCSASALPVSNARVQNSQPRTGEQPAQSGEMLSPNVRTSARVKTNYQALEWAFEQDAGSASASRLLIEIARHSVGGVCQVSQAKLGAACSLSERQTRTLIASLVADGLIARERIGGAGKGRSPDRYTLVGYAETQPAEITESQEATGNDCRKILPVAEGQPEVSDRKRLPVGATGSAAPTPPIRYNSTLRDNLQPTELAERGVQGGDLFEPAPAQPAAKTKPVGKRQPRREKFYAAETTMPSEPSASMLAYAAKLHLLNGTCATEFIKFRHWHIEQRTLIANIDQRWQTWVNNWADKNPTRRDGAPKGYKLAGVGADGKARYVKDHRTNVYR